MATLILPIVYSPHFLGYLKANPRPIASINISLRDKYSTIIPLSHLKSEYFLNIEYPVGVEISRFSWCFTVGWFETIQTRMAIAFSLLHLW